MFIEVTFSGFVVRSEAVLPYSSVPQIRNLVKI